MPNTPKHRLKNLDLTSISLVARGDDPMARVVLAKSESSDPVTFVLDSDDFRHTALVEKKKPRIKKPFWRK